MWVLLCLTYQWAYTLPQSLKILLKVNNYCRNMEYTIEKVLYTYLHKRVPCSLVYQWNKLYRAQRDWLKEKPTLKSKLIETSPVQIPVVNNKSLNNFKLTGFKNSLMVL